MPWTVNITEAPKRRQDVLIIRLSLSRDDELFLPDHVININKNEIVSEAQERDVQVSIVAQEKLREIINAIIAELETQEVEDEDLSVLNGQTMSIMRD